MREIIAAFAAQAAQAFVLKTASSIDDVLWLAKFLTPDRSRAERGRNVAVYVGVCMLQTVLAFLIARSGEETLDRFVHVPGFSSERILACVAALGLGLYSSKLFFEELRERFGDGDDDVPTRELFRRCLDRKRGEFKRVLSPRGYFSDESRRRRGCDVDVPWRRVAAPPRLRRGCSVEKSHGAAAAATWMFRGDESRRRRGCDVG